MTIEEFIAVDKQEGYIGKYRVIDNDICVGLIRPDADTSTFVINTDVKEMLLKMEVDSYYSVFDIRHVLWANADAKSWIKTEYAEQVVKGYALIAESKLSSMLADIWVRMVDLPFPVKKFTRFCDGMAWIQDLKEQHIAELERAA